MVIRSKDNYLFIVALIIFLPLGYLQNALLDRKYSSSLPNLLLVLLVVFFIIPFWLEHKKEKRVFTYLSMLLFLGLQTLMLVFPSFHLFLVNRFTF